jgi:integrase
MKVPEPRQLKSGNWFIQLRLGGQSVPVTASTKTACIHTAQLIKAEHRAGKRVVAEKKAPTLRQAIDAYITERSNVLSPSTIVGYRDIQRNRFQAYMDLPLDKINWQQAVNKEGKSPKTIKNALGLMRTVSRLNGCPIPDDIRLPAPIKAERPWLTPEQITQFCELVKGQKCEIPALLALHSLRKSEVCGLEWGDVDLTAGTIRVAGVKLIDETGTWQKRQQNKNLSSARTVKIFIPQLQEALKAVEDKTGFVIKAHPETPYRQIQAICKENSLPQVGWHGLRHSFASLCYSKGIPELICMRLGGWSDYQTMRKIYTHLSEHDQDTALSTLDAFFSDKNANKNANKDSDPLETQAV